MGLIKWVKDQYYNHKLNQADNYANQGRLDEAKAIYTAILDKQEMAVVHLAKMLSDNSDTVEKLLASLRCISDLSKYKTDSNSNDFQKEFEKYLLKVEDKADALFNNKNYSPAVLLIRSLISCKVQPKQIKKLYRYEAYEAFYKSQNDSYKNCKSSIDVAISHIKSMSSFPDDDLCKFKEDLLSDARYARTVMLLLPFEGRESWIDQAIISSIIAIISSKDCELKSISKISSICTSNTLAYQTASKLAVMSLDSAKKKDYKTCVLFDTYAAEYLSNDNCFNNNRCVHALEELSTRANAEEIQDVFNLAKDLGLSDIQITSLLKKIEQIANQAEDTKAIKICQLFKENKTFGNIYISKALSLCEHGKNNTLDSKELLSIIKLNTTGVNYPDCLGKFVNYIVSFDKEYYNSAINRILGENNLELLKIYWEIKPNTIFFDKIVSLSNPLYETFVSYFVENHTRFLCNDTFKQAFCKASYALNKEEYILSTLELLLNKNCDVNDFYETIILEYAQGKSNDYSLKLINHALNIVKNKRFIDYKKSIIRKLISSKQFDLAERESLSLNDIDTESWTLLAEVYYSKAKVLDDRDAKITFYEKVVQLNVSHELKSHFKSNLDRTFSELSGLSVQLYEDGLHQQAYSICDHLYCNQSVWLSLYITLRDKERESLSTIGAKIKNIEESFETIKQCVEKDVSILNDAYNELWIELTSLNIEKSKYQPNEKAIENLEHLRTKLFVYCNEKTKNDEGKRLTELIVKLKWSYAQELEHEELFDKATTVYESTADEHVASYHKRAVFRALICHLKNNNIDSNIEQSIQSALEEKSYESLREDIAYRYACYLIKATRPTDAERIISEYLPEEKYLLEVCKSIYVKEAEMYLDDFNGKLVRISDGSMTVKEAMSFLKEFNSYKTNISSQLTDISAKFGKCKVQLIAYILKCFFNEEKYIDAYKALRKLHPNFIENDTAYRNIAVAAIGIIESDSDNESMLQSAISFALSAIYTDRLFVKSLDQTSWDDQYEFTLSESLGQTSESDYDELPDNVNFDIPVENKNISIRNVQNNLLIRIETAVRTNHPALEAFYNEEKKALDQLLDLNLDEEFCIATPGLLDSDESIKTSIKEALDYDYDQGYGNQEDVLCVGLMYGFKDGEYHTYELAKEALEKCKHALSNTNTTTSLDSAFSSSSISKIKDFDQLYAELKAVCSSKMNTSISSKMAYEAFLDYYEIICKAINDVRMSMSCANYINGEIIQRLNNKTMKLRDGIPFMVRIYNLAPSNIQVKGNVEGILNNLVHEAEKSNSSLDRNALKRALSNLNGEFKSKIELATIIAKVNYDRIEEYDALQQLYDLYVKQPSNEEICKNLAAIIKICIPKYIIDTESYKEKSAVRLVLKKLKNNRSVIFKKYAKMLGLEYLQIMSKLPEDTRMLIMTGINLQGDSLNAKGRALKEGLDFMFDLGDVDEIIHKNR